ncbi:phosphatase PAP2 family protein [Patescibacteria group bacterium]|nr:phosphatase PAP2 family protein [Patescibacteria group bacterium]
MTSVIIFAANYLLWIIIAVALTVFIFAERTTKRSLFWTAIIALPLSFLMGKIASSLFFDPRPFVIEHIQPLIPHAVNNGFPSDHTLFASTVAMIVFLHYKRTGIVLMALALIVGIARVLAKVHSPIDIISGVVIAILAVYLSTAINTLIRKPFLIKKAITGRG